MPAAQSKQTKSEVLSLALSSSWIAGKAFHYLSIGSYSLPSLKSRQYIGVNRLHRSTLAFIVPERCNVDAGSKSAKLRACPRDGAFYRAYNSEPHTVCFFDNFNAHASHQAESLANFGGMSARKMGSGLAIHHLYTF
jgi:hypothetical protein